MVVFSRGGQKSAATREKSIDFGRRILYTENVKNAPDGAERIFGRYPMGNEQIIAKRPNKVIYRDGDTTVKLFDPT